MLFRFWVWTKKITEWYKKCGEGTRNFLWMKKSGAVGTSTEVTLNWDHGRRMRDQGWRMKVLHSNAVPSREFQWHCQFAAQEGTFQIGYTAMLVSICWSLNMCPVPWESGIMCLRQTSQSDGRIEREANSALVMPWKGLQLSPVAGRTMRSSGMEGIRETGRDWVSERGFWDDLSYFKLWKIVQEKCIFSMVNIF